jgi:Flp pilus assembly protein TadG
VIVRARRDDGQVTPFVVIMTVTVLLCAGLVIDGSRILAARRQAADVAAGAARAGAQAVSVDELRATNRHVLDPGRARDAAYAYLELTGRPGTVEVAADTVTVHVEITTPMVILGVAGIVERTVTGTESARTVRGVTGAGT